jgi:hypothetical protein
MPEKNCISDGNYDKLEIALKYIDEVINSEDRYLVLKELIEAKHQIIKARGM